MFGANNKIASHEKETKILTQQKIRRCKKGSSKDFRTDRYNNQNKNLSEWAQQQNGRDRRKN